MKKLLVTVIGATAAIGAFAGYPLQFDTFADGATSTNALNTAHGGDYWYANPEATDNAYTIEALTSAGTLDGSCPLPTGDTPDKALSIKTKFKNPLSANFVDGGAATNINNGLFFDSLVKFTVCDTVPETDSYDNAKIVMWLQEDEDRHETNLWVRAGYLSADGTTISSVSTNYMTGFGISDTFADKWHRVTIKAIADITEDGDNVEVPGFAIYIDANDNQPTPSVTCGAAKWDGTFGFTLTEDAAFLNLSGAVFPSMVQSGANKQTLEAVAFDGTGSISDLVFTDQAPAFADDFVEPKASITIGQLVREFTTLEAAVEEVNGVASGDVTLALMKDMTLSETLAFASAANVTFDFAGFVLTNNGNTPAISNAGTLTITNSTGDVGGIVCPDVNNSRAAAVMELEGATSLTIAGGNFWGDIAADELAGETITISGGAFLQDALTLEELGVQLADGKKISDTQNDDGLYEVVIDGVASVGGTEYLTLAEAVEAATAGQTVTVLKDCEVTEPITFSVGIVVSNDYTISTKAAYTLRFANGNTPVTICGNGEIVWDAGAGSPLLVGNNEATAKQSSYGIAGVYAGSLILNGGTIRTGAIGDGSGNMIKVENGSFVMNGGEVSGKPTRCIKADAEAGDATATVVINGGVISNTVVKKYDGSSLQPVALNASAKNNGTASITVNGGQITGTISGTVTIPAASTAQFDRDQTAFCVADYKTVLSDGWYVVTAKVYYTAVSLNKNETSIETNLTETLTATFTPASAADDTYTWASSAPAIATVDQNGVVTAVAAGEATITVTATHDSSVTASCTVTVTATEPTPAEPTIDPAADTPSAEVPAASAADAIDAVKLDTPAGVDEGKYKELFDISAVETSPGSGKYTVTVNGIKETVEAKVEESAMDVLDGKLDAKVQVPAGLYYKVTTYTELGGTAVETKSNQSDGNGVNVTKPGTTQGFIKIEMSPKAIN